MLISTVDNGERASERDEKKIFMSKETMQEILHHLINMQ